MATARAMDCPSVWHTHAPAARRGGVREAVINTLRERRPLPPMRPDDTVIVNGAMEFIQTHTVSQKTFEAALEPFGAQHLTALTVLMGHDAQTTFTLNAFNVQLSEQRTEPLLPVSCRRKRSWPRRSPARPPRNRASHICRAGVP
jgi:4-carboxymuconolactone decarboxylase